MYTSVPSSPYLEQKPSPISNQPLKDTVNSSLLQAAAKKKYYIYSLHSFIPALPTPRPLKSRQLSSSSQVSLSMAPWTSILGKLSGSRPPDFGIWGCAVCTGIHEILLKHIYTGI